LQSRAQERLAPEGADFLRKHWVPHLEPCLSLKSIGGSLWTARYRDGFMISSCARRCRGTREIAEYFLGLGEGDCDSWYVTSAGKVQVCLPQEVSTLVQTHGPVVEIARTGSCVD